MDALATPFLYVTGHLHLRGAGTIGPRRRPDDAVALPTNHHRLLWLMAGSLSVVLDGTSHRWHAGQVVCLEAGVRGRIVAAEGVQQHALFDLTPQPRLIGSRGQPVAAAFAVQPGFAVTLGRAAPLLLDRGASLATQRAFMRWRLLSDGGAAAHLRRQGLLADLLAGIVAGSSLPHAGEHGLIALARGLAPAERSVAALARVAGCSMRELQRRCLAETQGPPRRLLALVIDEEITALVSAGVPLAEIAARTGLPSAAAVAAAFRRWHGCSPSAWRRA